MKTRTLGDCEWLVINGFTVGPRDPEVNPEFPGDWMVTDGTRSIVGDNLRELVSESAKIFRGT